MPYEESIRLYSPLDLHVLKNTKYEKLIDITEYENAVAIIPFLGVGVNNLLTKVVSQISDSNFLNRLRIEFAGIANQIIAADSLLVNDTEVLIRACKRGARIINPGH